MGGLIDLDALKHSVSLSSIVARRVKLKQRGAELVGLCPFHDERTPSFGVNDDQCIYHCFGCGAGGDVITFVQETEGLDFFGAVRWLQGGCWPDTDPTIRKHPNPPAAAHRDAKIAEAALIWRSALPPAGTPAETYARSRGITSPLPRSIRFTRTWTWKKHDTGKTGPVHPALIGAVQSIDGAVVGIQRVFLNASGTGKADFRNPKRSLGRIRGCALRLGPPALEIVVCEGPEDGLTLAEALPGVSVWVALGTSFMPALELPECTKVVILAGDNNAPGRAAIAAAGAAFMAKGLEVRTMFPEPAYADFNDQLRGIHSER